MTTMLLTSSGEGVIYAMDETTGSMQVSHKLVVSSKDFPGNIFGIRCIYSSSCYFP